jgi:hypothetical protein
MQLDAAARARIVIAYEALLKAGRDALLARRYDDAINAANAAVGLIPDDPRGPTLLAQALQARDDALRAARVLQLLADGRNALNNKLIRIAEVAFFEARRLAPDDPAVRKALDDLAAARRPVDLGRQKRLASYQAAIISGQKALDAKRYRDAVAAFTSAAEWVRNDQDPSLFQAADQARRNAAALEAQRVADERAAKVRTLVANGRSALKANRLADATKAVGDAKRLAPNDPDVQQLDRDVEAARRAAAAPMQFTLRTSPATVKLAQGGRATVQITADRTGGYQGQINIELRGLPVGVTAGRVVIAAGQTTASLDLQAAFTAQLGMSSSPYAVGSRSGGASVNSLPFTVNVVKR